MAGEGSAKVPAEMAGIPLANKLNILWVGKVFGSVISFGSGQIASNHEAGKAFSGPT